MIPSWARGRITRQAVPEFRMSKGIGGRDQVFINRLYRRRDVRTMSGRATTKEANTAAYQVNMRLHLV